MNVRTMILALALGMASPAMAAGAGMKSGLDRMVKELNLTPEQKEKVREIKKNQGAGMREHKAKVHEAMKDLAQSMKAPEKGDAYKAKLKQKFETVQALRNEMMAKRFQVALEIREILSAEQIEKFRAMDMDKGGFGKGRGKKKHDHDEDDKDE